MITLSTELGKISGVAEKFLAKLEKLGIKTVRDLLWHFPFRYDDFSRVVKISELKLNQTATIRGMVKKVAVRRTWKRKMFLIEALLVDETGGIKAVWFNQPYIAQILKPGRMASFAGKVTMSDEEVYMSNPAYELISSGGEAKHTAGLIPVYPETRGLTSKGLRFLIKPIIQAIESVEDFIPPAILEKQGLADLYTSIRHIHFPRLAEQAEQARRRFAFDDLFLLQLNNIRMRSRLAKEKAPSLSFPPQQYKKIVEDLPFPLTDSQKRSLDEVLADIARPTPMNRLLQGDVGSGKTVVAAVAALATIGSGKQTAFMAPTEVLARQHYKTLTGLFSKMNVGVGLLIGSEARASYGKELEAKKTKPGLLKEIANNKINVVIGTHALIQKDVQFHDLALVIVDEQHRFGVDQRAALVKHENHPGSETTVHFLSMSATPIPRTLSLTLFGDLDISIIDELPKGRKPIMTKVVAPENRSKAYAFVREQIKKGRQAFVICPRIEASTEGDEEAAPSADKRKDLWADVKNVTEEFERLSKTVFPDLKVAMLHGKMKSKEKEQIMRGFSEGETDILISTSVIEVGVDVPNASIMMIEGADRFGLAQLYQFRGRVGRGEHQSFCFLFTDSSSDTTSQRLKALLDAKNGFELAEKDLAIRGPGQFLGDKQTGLPDLAMRSLNNMELVKSAREAAVEIFREDHELSIYPLLKAKVGEFEKRLHLE